MKKKVVLLVLLVLAGAGLFRGGMAYGASSTGAGSVSDPLISQSYLEKRLSEVTGSSGSMFTAVMLSKGQTAVLSEGTQAVIYYGTATVSGNEGLIDTTAGTLLSSGKVPDKYHMLLSPGSNSGIKATSSVTIYIKGTYSVE